MLFRETKELMLVAEEGMALLALQAAVGEAMVTAALLPVQNEMIPEVSSMVQFHYQLLQVRRLNRLITIKFIMVYQMVGDPRFSQAPV